RARHGHRERAPQLEARPEGTPLHVPGRAGEDRPVRGQQARQLQLPARRERQQRAQRRAALGPEDPGAVNRASPLRRRDLDPDPLRQFEAWYAAAQAAGEQFPQAFALATSTPDGRPSVRMVLLKSADETGFVFYSSYESRKGRELAANPRAALCFYWHGLGRQARIEGEAARGSDAEAGA